jgi:hypothetical protein
MSKYALCIGINYPGTGAELSGCVNDALALREFLVDECAFQTEHVTVLRDDRGEADEMPTRANIVAHIRSMFGKGEPGDKVFLSFSGHGGQTMYARHRRRTESDGKDEFLFPCDYATTGVLLDHHLQGIVSHLIKPGVQLTILTDACHSGTAWDFAHNLYVRNFRLHTYREPREQTSMRELDVLSISGCVDAQTSADAVFEKGAYGAMTHTFLECVRMCKSASLKYLVLFMNVLLHQEGFTQRPQLGSTKPLDKAYTQRVFLERL